MNFAELQTELSARGFNYLTATRLGQYVNWARGILDDEELWPYREAVATGASPLAIADLGPIESVQDNSTKDPLEPRQRRTLMESYGSITTTGTPLYYYVVNPSGAGYQVATYPVGGTINVQYWRVTPDLTGTQTPLAPTRFHKTIVDIAVREAYRDKDEHAAAEATEAQIQRDLQKMRETLLNQQTQGPEDYQRIVFASEDW